MPMLKRVICDYEPRRLKEAGELSGSSENDRADAMPVTTQTDTFSAIEDSTGPGELDEVDIWPSASMGRCERRRKHCRETEQILTNILISREAELSSSLLPANRRSSDGGTSPATIISALFK